MKKIEKSLFVKNLSEEIKTASSVVLIDYSGMGVKTQQELKKRLSKVGAKMVIVKNTLFKLAATDSNTPNEVYKDSVLSGPTALVITEDDPISPLQVLSGFAKEFDVLQLKVGIIEGSYQEQDDLLKLSTLPGKDVLYAQAIGAIGAPLYGLIFTLRSNMQKLVYILDTASKSK